MKEKIKIDKSILFLSEKGYYNGELTIWGNKINADLEVWENNEFITKIMENISWINMTLSQVFRVTNVEF